MNICDFYVLILLRWFQYFWPGRSNFSHKQTRKTPNVEVDAGSEFHLKLANYSLIAKVQETYTAEVQRKTKTPLAGCGMRAG
jgi:hypothetical protein